MFAPMNVIRWSEQDGEQRRRLLERPVFESPGLSAAVSGIIARVRDGGDRALAELTAELDGCEPDCLEVAAADIAAAHEERVWSSKGTLNRVIRMPAGPAVIITPWNAPFMLSTWKCAPALAAGNYSNDPNGSWPREGCR